MADRLTRVAFWLIPVAGQREDLQKCIDQLAKQYQATSFVPHVTIYSCRRSPGQEELAIARQIAADTHGFSAVVEGLAGENVLTRALYLKLSHNRTIEQLYLALHSKVPQPSTFKLRPHLSLLYQNIDALQSERLRREIDIAIDKLPFEELWAVAIPQQLKTEADLVGWQILFRGRLATGEIAVTL